MDLDDILRPDWVRFFKFAAELESPVKWWEMEEDAKQEEAKIRREKMADHVDQTKEMEKSSTFTHDPKEGKESLPSFMKSSKPAIVESFNSPILSRGLVGRTAAEAGESSISRDGLVQKPCEESGNSAGFVDQWPIDSTPRSKDVCIDILPREIEYGQWTVYIDSKKARADKNWPLDIETTNAIGRAEAAATALRSGFSCLSYAAAGAKIFSNTAVLGGLAFELAGFGQRDVKPKLALAMVKIGAILTASAVIVSLATAIPPALAWPFGTAATLLVAYSVAKS